MNWDLLFDINNIVLSCLLIGAAITFFRNRNTDTKVDVMWENSAMKIAMDNREAIAAVRETLSEGQILIIK
jgi:hypothetical protein